MKPTIGRIVHYVLSTGEHRAAMIVDVSGDNPHLQVYLRADDIDPDTGSRLPTGKLSVYRDHVLQDETTKGSGSWHWPEREA